MWCYVFFSVVRCSLVVENKTFAFAKFNRWSKKNKKIEEEFVKTKAMLSKAKKEASVQNAEDLVKAKLSCLIAGGSIVCLPSSYKSSVKTSILGDGGMASVAVESIESVSSTALVLGSCAVIVLIGSACVYYFTDAKEEVSPEDLLAEKKEDSEEAQQLAKDIEYGEEEYIKDLQEYKAEESRRLENDPEIVDVGDEQMYYDRGLDEEEAQRVADADTGAGVFYGGDEQTRRLENDPEIVDAGNEQMYYGQRLDEEGAQRVADADTGAGVFYEGYDQMYYDLRSGDGYDQRVDDEYDQRLEAQQLADADAYYRGYDQMYYDLRSGDGYDQRLEDENDQRLDEEVFQEEVLAWLEWVLAAKKELFIWFHELLNVLNSIFF